MENNKSDCSLGALLIYIAGMALVCFWAKIAGGQDDGSFNWANAIFIVVVFGGAVTWMFTQYLIGHE